MNGGSLNESSSNSCQNVPSRYDDYDDEYVLFILFASVRKCFVSTAELALVVKTVEMSPSSESFI